MVGVVLCDDLLAEEELVPTILEEEVLRCVPLDDTNELPGTSELGLCEDIADALLDCDS